MALPTLRADGSKSLSASLAKVPPGWYWILQADGREAVLRFGLGGYLVASLDRSEIAARRGIDLTYEWLFQAVVNEDRRCEVPLHIREALVYTGGSAERIIDGTEGPEFNVPSEEKSAAFRRTLSAPAAQRLAATLDERLAATLIELADLRQTVERSGYEIGRCNQCSRPTVVPIGCLPFRCRECVDEG